MLACSILQYPDPEGRIRWYQPIHRYPGALPAAGCVIIELYVSKKLI